MFIFCILLSFLLSGQVFASNSTQISNLFKTAFFSESVYRDNYCGQNIQRFVGILRDAAIPLKGTYMIEIVNKGIQDFGMVAARKTRSYDRNWFHHVVFYDGTYIYDFDFSPKPTPIKPSEYFHQMFKTDRMKTDFAYCDKHIGRYQLTFYAMSNQSTSEDGRRPGQVKKLPDMTGWGCDYNGGGKYE